MILFSTIGKAMTTAISAGGNCLSVVDGEIVRDMVREARVRREATMKTACYDNIVEESEGSDIL